MENNFIKLVDYKHLPKIKGVYIIENSLNHKVYIGSTFSNRGICNRIYEHLRQLRNNIHNNKYLQNSFNKYSENVFLVRILEDCTNKSNKYIRERELYFLDKFNLNNCTYNIAQIDINISEFNFEKYKSTYLNKLDPDRKGVYFCNYYKKYVVSIHRDNRQIITLYYKTEEEARDIYKKLYNLPVSEIKLIKPNLLRNKYKKPPKKKENTTSKYKGITFDKTRNKWRSIINVASKNIFIGRFNSEIEAAIAYNNYVLSHKINKELNNVRN